MNKLDYLLDKLIETYSIECPYYKKAQEIFGKNLINDHIAFRCIDLDFSYVMIQNIWEQLGYTFGGSYDLGNKKAVHLNPPSKKYPKIFISTFKIHDLSTEDFNFVRSAFHYRNIPSSLDIVDSFSCEYLSSFFLMNPYYTTPKIDVIEKLNSIDQYLAWVRLFGHKVNHFTLSCNALNMPIDEVYHQMKNYGIPMKKNIEGLNTELAQTSTEAFSASVEVRDKDNNLTTMFWPYAYYEIIERGMSLFDGFKAHQTPQLFDMTRKE